MPIRVFTLPKVVMQFRNIIGNDGAYARKTLDKLVRGLPVAQLIRDVMEKLKPLTFRRWNGAKKHGRTGNATQLATSINVRKLPEHM